MGLKMNRVVMIWLDGFSSRYLNRQKTPFIAELAQSGFSTTLEPLFAFAGIGASTFTSTTVNSHKFWTDYMYDISTHYPAILKYFFHLCDLLPSDIPSSYARYVACRVMGINPGTPNLIPVSLVDYFRTKEQKRLTGHNPIEGTTTLFDQMREHDVPFLTVGFYESILETRIVNRVLKALTEDYRFILFRLGSLDKLGHRYGPESPEMTKKLGKINSTVREVVETGQRLDSQLHFVIFSDHGMVPVKEHVDITSLLERLPVKMVEDYIMFLNSTVASFWFSNEKAKQIITEALGKVKTGVVLDETKLKELEIEKIGAEYGELLFTLKEGNVFFPDFYRRRKPPKGMHGYAFPTYDKPPFIIYTPGTSYKTGQNVNTRFIDVMPTVLDLLNLPATSTCVGKSLLKS